MCSAEQADQHAKHVIILLFIKNLLNKKLRVKGLGKISNKPKNLVQDCVETLRKPRVVLDNFILRR